jgi:hypothetical protein
VPSILATAQDTDGQQYPALVVQRFGRGRSAALTIGDVWRWGMQSPEARADMDKAWRQMLRWLVADVPDRVSLAVEPQAGDASGGVRLQVRVRDEQYHPLDNASVQIAIEPVTIGSGSTGATNVLRLNAEPSLSEAGVYEVAYVPHLTGGFRAVASVTNALGADMGRAEAGWVSDLAADEFRSLVPNIALLEQIAKRTGGRLVQAKELPSFVEQLPAIKAPVMEPYAVPLWHTPVLFGLAFGVVNR